MGTVLATLLVLSGGISLAFAQFPFPMGVRLDLGPTNNSYVVRWISDEFGSYLGNDVLYGPADHSSNRTAIAATRTVLAWADDFRWLRPLRLHEATLTGLAPGAEYRYQVPEDAERRFAVPGPDSVRVVALGDMGSSGEAARLVSLAADRDPHLAIVAGDLAYAGADASDWVNWFETVEPLASGAPLLPARGNHEIEPPFGSRLFRENFPGHGSYYSYDAGPVHFVHLDSEISFSDEGAKPSRAAQRREDAQEDWLGADLAAARANGAAWLIVVFHEPMYSSGRHHTSNLDMRARWGPIFDANAVDLVIQAHEHNYQRSYPLRDDRVVSSEGPSAQGEGTIYLVTGGGGRRLYDRFVEPAPQWSAKRIAAHEFLDIDITRDRIEVRAVGLGGETLDTFEISALQR